MAPRKGRRIGGGAPAGVLSADEVRELDEAIGEVLARVQVSAPALPDAAEPARRDAAFERILHLREEMGPIDVPVWELIRADREG